MPIEVEDIQPETQAIQAAESVTEAPPEPAVTEAPAPKRRGRPAGSKNKPKSVAEEPPEPPDPVPKAAPAPKPPARVKKAKVVAPPPSESSEEEEDEPEPLSPATHRRAQWAEYRQRQVDAHQQQVQHYTRALDKMLGF